MENGRFAGEFGRRNFALKYMILKQIQNCVWVVLVLCTLRSSKECRQRCIGWCKDSNIRVSFKTDEERQCFIIEEFIQSREI